MGLERLESIGNDFNYDKQLDYVKLFKDYLSEAKAFLENNTKGTYPIFDLYPNTPDLFPPEIEVRLEKATCSLPPISKRVCRWYLKEIRESEATMLDTKSFYENLIRIFEGGGWFHRHHNDISRGDITILIK